MKHFYSDDVKKMEFGKTQNEKLNLDLQEKAWATLYVEANI